MSVSLPSDKLLEIQQLVHSFLKKQPITVHQVISFLCKTTFHSSGYVQLCQLCCVIQSDMLHVYHSPAHLYVLFTFLFQHGVSFRYCLVAA